MPVVAVNDAGAANETEHELELIDQADELQTAVADPDAPGFEFVIVIELPLLVVAALPEQKLPVPQVRLCAAHEGGLYLDSVTLAPPPIHISALAPGDRI